MTTEPVEPRPPTVGEETRINEAVIGDTVRIAALAQSSMGFLPGSEQVGGVTVRSNFNLDELLEGLRGVGVTVASQVWPTVEDVIVKGYGADPALFPADQIATVEHALVSAIDTVTMRIERSWGVA